MGCSVHGVHNVYIRSYRPDPSIVSTSSIASISVCVFIPGRCGIRRGAGAFLDRVLRCVAGLFARLGGGREGRSGSAVGRLAAVGE